MQSYTTNGCKWRVKFIAIGRYQRMYSLICAVANSSSINTFEHQKLRETPNQVWNYNPNSTLVHADIKSPCRIRAENFDKQHALLGTTAQEMLRSLVDEIQTQMGQAD